MKLECSGPCRVDHNVEVSTKFVSTGLICMNVRPNVPIFLGGLMRKEGLCKALN